MASTPSDLVQRAARGERTALTALLEQHGPGVWESLAGEIPSRWQSVLSREDVMQQTYTDAILDVGRFSATSEEAFSAWLATLARRNLIDAIRMLEAEKRGGGRHRIEPASTGESFVALFETLGGSSRTASREAAVHEAQTAVQHAIEQLPDAYQRVVRMYDLEGCSAEHVASAMQRSTGAVFMLRARAHRRLAEIMGTASRYLSDSA